MPNWLSVWGVGILGKGSFYILYTFSVCLFFILSKKINEYSMKQYTMFLKFNCKILNVHAPFFNSTF